MRVGAGGGLGGRSGYIILIVQMGVFFFEGTSLSTSGLREGDGRGGEGGGGGGLGEGVVGGEGGVVGEYSGGGLLLGLSPVQELLRTGVGAEACRLVDQVGSGGGSGRLGCCGGWRRARARGRRHRSAG